MLLQIIYTLKHLSVDFYFIRFHDLLNCSTNITKTNINPRFLKQIKKCKAIFHTFSIYHHKENNFGPQYKNQNPVWPFYIKQVQEHYSDLWMVRSKFIISWHEAYHRFRYPIYHRLIVYRCLLIHFFIVGSLSSDFYSIRS